MASSQKKYSTLVSNTLLFAISNFSSKLLSFFIRPYLSYALDTPDIMGVSSLLQQAGHTHDVRRIQRVAQVRANEETEQLGAEVGDGKQQCIAYQR